MMSLSYMNDHRSIYHQSSLIIFFRTPASDIWVLEASLEIWYPKLRRVFQRYTQEGHDIFLDSKARGDTNFFDMAKVIMHTAEGNAKGPTTTQAALLQAHYFFPRFIFDVSTDILQFWRFFHSEFRALFPRGRAASSSSEECALSYMVPTPSTPQDADSAHVSPNQGQES